jgi:hypothetical protein
MFGCFIQKIKELSFGGIFCGIGLIGFSKTAIEVFENHRLDKILVTIYNHQKIFIPSAMKFRLLF